MQLNILLMILLGIGLLLVVIILFNMRKNAKGNIEIEEKLTFDKVLEITKKELVRIVNDNNFDTRSDDVWEAVYKRKKRIEKAYKNCVHGIQKDKITVIGLIRSIWETRLENEKDLLDIVDFDSPLLEPEWKHEIILYALKKEHKEDALGYLINKYGWDKPRRDVEGGDFINYAVDYDNLDDAFTQEVPRRLRFEEMLDVFAIGIYDKIKGFGILDTILEMNIDGVDWGTSGSIKKEVINPGSTENPATRSAWVYFHGIHIHFRYLSFGTVEECRRISLAVCRFNNRGQLTEKRGYMINTMWDMSRVIVFRPTTSEYWAGVIRKFSLGTKNLEQLLNPLDENGNPIYHNTQLVFNTVRFLMMCMITSSFSGRQGAGKTTAMVRAIQFVPVSYTIRVLETVPEMYLRELYDLRDILSLSETQYLSLEELQNAIKKADSAISIVGEVAQNIVAARMLELGQVASLFTIFSIHTNTGDDLVNYLVNAVVAVSNGAATPETVLPQVLDVVKCDIHFDYDIYGHRYVERVTEIIPLAKKPYPEYDPEDPVNSMNRIQREYYVRMTDRKMYECRDILHFDLNTYTYVANDQFFTKALTERMYKRCPVEYREEFMKFVLDNWSKKERLTA